MRTHVDAYHEKLLQFWTEHQGCGLPGLENVPHLGQHRRLVDGTFLEGPIQVLFVGINPSFDRQALEKHWRAAVAPHHPSLGEFESGIKWKPDRRADELKEMCEALCRLDHHSRKVWDRYYQPIEQLAAEAGAKWWHHVDLLPLRVHKQKVLAAGLRKSVDALDWSTQLHSLVGLTTELISAWQPRVVVVLNALASTTLEARLELRLQHNGHRYQTRDHSHPLSGATFLLGSQLSGGATSAPAFNRLRADLRDLLRGGNGLDGGDVPRVLSPPPS